MTPIPPLPAKAGEYGECQDCGSCGTEHPCWCCGGTNRFITKPIIGGCEQVAYQTGRPSRWFRWSR